MELMINGKSVTLPASCTVAELLASRGLKPQMVLVEHNGEILDRERYARVTLSTGDVLEILQMMAGG